MLRSIKKNFFSILFQHFKHLEQWSISLSPYLPIFQALVEEREHTIKMYLATNMVGIQLQADLEIDTHHVGRPAHRILGPWSTDQGAEFMCPLVSHLGTTRSPPARWRPVKPNPDPWSRNS